jgi:hypothetical protein
MVSVFCRNAVGLCTYNGALGFNSTVEKYTKAINPKLQNNVLILLWSSHRDSSEKIPQAPGLPECIPGE